LTLLENALAARITSPNCVKDLDTDPSGLFFAKKLGGMSQNLISLHLAHKVGNCATHVEGNVSLPYWQTVHSPTVVFYSAVFVGAIHELPLKECQAPYGDLTSKAVSLPK
jgi:hypothetical protein